MPAKQRNANDRVERELERLKELRLAGQSDAALLELGKTLGDRVNVVVAKAAAIAAEWQARSLLPQLLTAFERLFVNPGETDQQCWGKNALSHALKELGCDESAVYLRGLRHRQWEAVWGGKEDTAAVLRATCVLALAQCADITRDEIMRCVVDALTESDARVRVDAARALEHMGGPDAVLLLRLKARAGDKEPTVTGQALECLLLMEGLEAIPFVAAFLKDSGQEVGEEAALALGASRLPPAVELLQNEWMQSKGKRSGAALLRAISASRLDTALDFLLNLVRTERPYEAEDALRALELHRGSPEVVTRVAQAVSEREEQPLCSTSGSRRPQAKLRTQGID